MDLSSILQAFFVQAWKQERHVTAADVLQLAADHPSYYYELTHFAELLSSDIFQRL
jgi:hypothetical protein